MDQSIKEKKIKILKNAVSSQLGKGMKEEEEEHSDVIGNSKKKVAKVALAHLKKDPEYYTHVAAMEKKYAK